METPVLLIIFNRFDTTKQVLDALRNAQVPRLYVYCDGPRSNKAGEAEQLALVQQQVLSAIDWPCQVQHHFKKENEGPRLAIGHAISWFFTHEEQGIILEHDCVPAPSFFSFCETLLDYYKDNERVMHISGDNFQFGAWRGDGSYYFSKLNHIWGFATWRRAWKHYDVQMKDYPSFRETGKIATQIPFKRGVKIWEDILDRTYSGALQTWDYQWTFAIWQRDALAILPNVNLVSNVGFDSSALNTTNPNHRLASMQTFDLKSIKHPSTISCDYEADKKSINDVFNPTILKFAFQKLGIIK